MAGLIIGIIVLIAGMIVGISFSRYTTTKRREEYVRDENGNAKTTWSGAYEKNIVEEECKPLKKFSKLV